MSHSLTVRSQPPLARVRPSGAKASAYTQLLCPASIRTLAPCCAPCISQSRMLPSKLPLASRLPSGLQATAYTGPLSPVSACSCVPLEASQRRTVAPSPPLASVCPSGEKATQWMMSVCRLVQSKAPRSNSHSFMNPSQLPVARVRPSGLKARAATASVCACQTRCSSFPASRHTRTSPLMPPAAQEVPSLLMATALVAAKASVNVESRTVTPASVVSCISTPCRDAPRMTSWDKSRPRKCPPCSQLGEQREQVLLHFGSLRVHVAQARQNWGHDEPLLGLPHVFTGIGQFQSMLDETSEPALLDLAARLRDELRGRILQHHRLQRKASRLFPPLHQGAPLQRLHGFQHLSTRERRAQHREQSLHRHRLAQDGQPQHHRLLDCREARELFGQQLAHTAKDHLALLQERSDLAPEELGDGLRHDFERQRVARVHLHQARPVVRKTAHFFF